MMSTVNDVKFEFYYVKEQKIYARMEKFDEEMGENGRFELG